ncbi:MAG: FAD binding domain-containing protein [Pseudonocardia sp.]|nr:FAD binding domain-containing protein [Pseudonocardia sp.]
MKPAAFDYRRPTTVAAALADLGSVPGARVLAGGQSLVPLLNLRLEQPPLLVDINRIPGLDEIEVRDERLHVGATARQGTVLTSSLAATAAPLLPAALAWVAHPQVRSRGTVVGSLCHHDPAAELPAVAVALDAEFVVVTADGTTRRIPASDFFGAPFETTIPAGALVTAVTFPVAAPGTRAGFAEIARKAKDIPILAVGAQVTVTDDRVSAARIAVSGLSARPQRMTASEDALLGTVPTDTTLAVAARAAVAEVDTALPARASADYRRRVLPTVVRRALATALALPRTPPASTAVDPEVAA